MQINAQTFLDGGISGCAIERLGYAAGQGATEVDMRIHRTFIQAADDIQA